MLYITQYQAHKFLYASCVSRILRNLSEQTEVALMHDAVHLFARALHDLSSSQRINIRPISCESRDTWDHGYSLVNYMRVVGITTALVIITITSQSIVIQMETRGLSGSVRFDSKGLRTDFTLEIVEINRQGVLQRSALWNPKTGINHTRSFGEIYDQIVENLQNKTFKVSSKLVTSHFLTIK